MSLALPTYSRSESLPLALAPVVLALVSAPTAAAQSGDPVVLELSPQLSASLIQHQVDSAGPESDWNCLDVGIMETGYRVIMPNYQSGDPVYVALMKDLAKDLWGETIFPHEAALTALSAEPVVGFEFAVFPANPGPMPLSWDGVASIEGVDAQGGTVTLGSLFVFGEDRWYDRLGELQTAMGGVPLSQHSVWRGSTLFGAGTGSSLRMQGFGNELYGPAYGGDTLVLGGGQWTTHDMLRHVGLYMQYGSGHALYGNASLNAPLPVPVPQRPVSAYLNEVDPLMLFSGDLQVLNDGSGNPIALDGTVLTGLVVVYGDVSFDASFVSAELTIVAGGSIDLNGSDNVLTAAVDGLLLYSYSTDLADAVALDGSDNLLTGSVHGTALEVRMGGSNNAVTGRLVGDRVKITGGANLFSDGTN